MNAKRAVLAATAAALFTSGVTLMATVATAGDDGGKMVHCQGVNGCKGQSDCKSAHNSCKAQNSCKGQGWKSMTKSDCEAAGGTPE